MNINNEKSEELKPSSETGWSKEIYQKRDFAAITDATSIILKNIGFPVNKHRNIVCVLQGIANGRDEFAASHLTLARRTGHQGDEEAAKMSVYRELQILKKFQFESQILLFDIEQGGGREYKSTRYIDYLTSVAVWLVNYAKEVKKNDGELRTAPLGKVMELSVGQAVIRLKSFAGSKLAEHYIPKGKTQESGKMKKAKLARRKTLREQMDDNLRRCLNEYNPALEEKALRAFASQVANYLIDTAETMIASAKKQNGSNLSAMMSSPSPVTILKTPNKNGEKDGLRGSSPSNLITEIAPDSEIAEKHADAGKAGTLPDTALGYARRGWKVIPLHTPDKRGICSCAKSEKCTSAGKHPRTAQGVKDATLDEAVIKNWWKRFPNANIGVACGFESGIICLDIDPRNGGDDALKRLIESHGELPSTFEVETGSGGKHFIFEYPQGLSFKNSSGKLGAGLDIKSDNGFIVAAPSLHKSGKFYRMLNDAKPAAMPDWVLQSLLTAERKANTCDNEAIPLPQELMINPFQNGSGKIILEGIRNDKLFRIACAMRGRNEEPAKIAAEIERVNYVKCLPPLSAGELQSLIKSALSFSINSK
jgi:hypothetical protein